MGWSESDLCGPEGEDWRVPVSELEFRQSMLAKALDNAGLEGALLHNPVDLYYFCGGRQDGAMYISAESKEIESVQYVRRSLKRAIFEAGGDNAIHEVVKFPRLSQFFETLKSHGIKQMPSMQLSSIPHSFASKFQNSLSSFEGELKAVSYTHLTLPTKA